MVPNHCRGLFLLAGAEKKEIGLLFQNIKPFVLALIGLCCAFFGLFCSETCSFPNCECYPFHFRASLLPTSPHQNFKPDRMRAALSRCFRDAFAVLSRRFRDAFAVLSRCFRGAFAALSRCFRGAFALSPIAEAEETMNCHSVGAGVTPFRWDFLVVFIL
jgi:hypothetical protein